MGTLRFPTDEQCVAAGDEDLIALQKWVKAQVLNARYGKQRNPELVRRLEGIGFDFEKWYVRPGKQKREGRKAGTSKAKVEGGEATTKAKAEEGAEEEEEEEEEEGVSRRRRDRGRQRTTRPRRTKEAPRTTPLPRRTRGRSSSLKFKLFQIEASSRARCM
ncbi:hypothetical protein ACHAWF_003418 [Thalassiosira exigua]